MSGASRKVKGPPVPISQWQEGGADRLPVMLGRPPGILTSSVLSSGPDAPPGWAGVAPGAVSICPGHRRLARPPGDPRPCSLWAGPSALSSLSAELRDSADLLGHLALAASGLRGLGGSCGGPQEAERMLRLGLDRQVPGSSSLCRHLRAGGLDGSPGLEEGGTSWDRCPGRSACTHQARVSGLRTPRPAPLGAGGRGG